MLGKSYLGILPDASPLAIPILLHILFIIPPLEESVGPHPLCHHGSRNSGLPIHHCIYRTLPRYYPRIFMALSVFLPERSTVTPNNLMDLESTEQALSTSSVVMVRYSYALPPMTVYGVKKRPGSVLCGTWSSHSFSSSFLLCCRSQLQPSDFLTWCLALTSLIRFPGTVAQTTCRRRGLDPCFDQGAWQRS